MHEFLRAFINETQDDWDTWCNYYKLCYNTTPGNHGYTPYKLVFGKRANLPIDRSEKVSIPVYNIDNYAKELRYRLKEAHTKTKIFLENEKLRRKLGYDKNLNGISIEIGDVVNLRDSTNPKLGKLYKGPYKITKII
jgi:hypothetical protein